MCCYLTTNELIQDQIKHLNNSTKCNDQTVNSDNTNKKVFQKLNLEIYKLSALLQKM